MTTRVLAVFPAMDTAAVEAFRGRWDPLAAAVPAHITVAFPFRWPGPASALAEELTPVLAGCPPFALELATPAIWAHEYLFLLVGRGREEVRRLHEAIYGTVLPDARRPPQFVPHLTIGRDADRAALSGALREAAELALPFAGRARALTVHRRDEDGRRVRELDLPLGGRVQHFACIYCR